MTRHLPKFISRLKIVNSSVCIVLSPDSSCYYKPLSSLNFARYTDQYGSYIPSSPLGVYKPLIGVNYMKICTNENFPLYSISLPVNPCEQMTRY